MLICDTIHDAYMWRRSGGICLPRVFCTGWSILSSGTTRPGQLSAVPAAHNNVHHTTQLTTFPATLISETVVLQDKYVNCHDAPGP